MSEETAYGPDPICTSCCHCVVALEGDEEVTSCAIKRTCGEHCIKSEVCVESGLLITTSDDDRHDHAKSTVCPPARSGHKGTSASTDESANSHKTFNVTMC